MDPNRILVVQLFQGVKSADRPEITREAELREGRFRVELGDVQDAIIQAHYLGGFPYGPCESKPVIV
jgi:hypothetical protein